MKLALALVLNAALLAALLPWLRYEWRACGSVWRAALVAGLVARFLLGNLRSAHPAFDASQFDILGQLLTRQLWAHPAGAWQLMTGNTVRFAGSEFVFYGMSNTLFMGKLMAALNLASLGMPWLNGVYLSLLSFLGCWQMARVLALVLPATPAGAGLMGFVLWPSSNFWAAGLSKEAVLLGSGAWLTALVLARIYGPPVVRSRWRAVWGWLGIAALALLHFQSRYFFAVPLLGGLVALALVQALQRWEWARTRWAQALVLGAVVGMGTVVAPQVSIAFSVNKFTSQLLRIYNHDLESSAGRPHFNYSDLRPTPESILAHSPQAVFNTLTRPWLGEMAEPIYVAAGLENALLLALLAGALVALVRGRGGRLPFALGLVLGGYCLLLAVLMGLSTPNLGSISRYRSTLLPFFLLLLLQNDYAATVLRRLGLCAPEGPALALSLGPAA